MESGASMTSWSATAGGRTLTTPRSFKNLPNWIQQCRDSVPSNTAISLDRPGVQYEDLQVTSDEAPREPWLFALDCAQDSERQEAEVNHLSRTDGYIGAAERAATRTIAAQ